MSCHAFAVWDNIVVIAYLGGFPSLDIIFFNNGNIDTLHLHPPRNIQLPLPSSPTSSLRSLQNASCARSMWVFLAHHTHASTHVRDGRRPREAEHGRRVRGRRRVPLSRVRPLQQSRPRECRPPVFSPPTPRDHEPTHLTMPQRPHV